MKKTKPKKKKIKFWSRSKQKGSWSTKAIQELDKLDQQLKKSKNYLSKSEKEE